MLSNFFDVIFIVIFLSCSLWGFFVGFINSILYLGTILIGILIAKPLHTVIQPYLIVFSSSNIASIASFVIIVFTLIIVAQIIKSLFIKKFSISLFNSIGGGLIGFFLGFLLNYTVLYLSATYVNFFKDDILSSKLAPFIYNFSSIIF